MNRYEFNNLLKSVTPKSINPKYLVNRIMLVKSWIMKDIRVKGMPNLYEIEVTNRCNLRCIMCKRHLSERRDDDLTFESFKTIADQAEEYCELMTMHVGGESFLNMEIFEMFDYAKKVGIPIWVSTNGTTLVESVRKKILNSPLNGLVISIDGASKETYEKIRIGSNYDKVVENVFALLKLAKDMKSKLFITIQMVVQDFNQHEVNEFVAQWSAYNVNVLYKPVRNWYAASFADLLYPNIICDRPWYQLIVRSDGTITLCPSDIELRNPLGNIKKDRISDIWNSEKMVRFREKVLLGKKTYEFCSRCDYAPARPRTLFGNTGLALLDMYSIIRLLYIFGYKKINR